VWLRLIAAAIVPLATVAVAIQIWSSESGPDVMRVPGGELVAVARDGAHRVLVRVDPLSLRPRRGSGRVRLRKPIEGWARAPVDSRFVVVTDRGSRLRFLDLDRMRAVGRLDTGARGAVAAVDWPRRDRMWVVLAAPGCCALGTTTVVTVDPVRRRLIARRRLAAGLTRIAATPDGPVLLLAPSATIGPATLATVDARGRVAHVVVDGVSAGVLPSAGAPFVVRVRRPGLAVDPRRHRAYLLPARPEVVEVDLRLRRVQYHPLSPRRSLVDRLRELLEASAEAEPSVGSERAATWLSPGLIAVSGRDAHVTWHPNGALAQLSRPAGLHVIDSEQWRVRTLDEHAAGFRAANGLLLTTEPSGLTAYRPDGRRAFHLLEDRRVELVAIAGSLAYVRTDHARSLDVVDLADGQVVATGADPSPRPLPDAAAGPWD
jgi:hypothetical protein